VELVPWGSLRRSEYKSKLVERSNTVEYAQRGQANQGGRSCR
jgi:hypothetical protein